jgi:hypothetical protein
MSAFDGDRACHRRVDVADDGVCAGCVGRSDCSRGATFDAGVERSVICGEGVLCPIEVGHDDFGAGSHWIRRRELEPFDLNGGAVGSLSLLDPVWVRRRP